MNTKYSAEFKEEAVAIALNSDRPRSEIALDLGVNYKTFTNWVRAAMSDDSKSSLINKNKPSKQDYQALERENRKMKKELLLRQKEIELLKKAAAYFAKEQS